MNPLRALLLMGLFVVASFSGLAKASVTIRDIARVRGQGEVKLSGLGYVTGLRGTGDDAKEAIIARPLGQLFKEGGNEPGSLKDFSKGKAVAVVWVTCTIPERGAPADEKIDVEVSTLLSATSLAGGRLITTALSGSLPNQPVVAMAEGAIEIEDPNTPTAARVRGGALMLADVLGPELLDEFDLIIDAPYVGWSGANQVAISINAKADPIGNAVAKALDERTVRVLIPKAERENRAAFLADVFNAEVNPSLLDLPAQIIANSRTGAIIVTGDVQVRIAGLTHKNLTITTVTPPPVGTALNPVVKRDTWTSVGNEGTPNETTRINDLIASFKQLNIPVADQISLLSMLHKSGSLHCKLIID
jgi:flagellar P-ring protein FlgI